MTQPLRMNGLEDSGTGNLEAAVASGQLNVLRSNVVGDSEKALGDGRRRDDDGGWIWLCETRRLSRTCVSQFARWRGSEWLIKQAKRRVARCGKKRPGGWSRSSAVSEFVGDRGNVGDGGRCW